MLRGTKNHQKWSQNWHKHEPESHASETDVEKALKNYGWAPNPAGSGQILAGSGRIWQIPAGIQLDLAAAAAAAASSRAFFGRVNLQGLSKGFPGEG